MQLDSIHWQGGSSSILLFNFILLAQEPADPCVGSGGHLRGACPHIQVVPLYLQTHTLLFSNESTLFWVATHFFSLSNTRLCICEHAPLSMSPIHGEGVRVSSDPRESVYRPIHAGLKGSVGEPVGLPTWNRSQDTHAPNILPFSFNFILTTHSLHRRGPPWDAIFNLTWKAVDSYNFPIDGLITYSWTDFRV